MKATRIMIADGNRLAFDGDRLATKEEYLASDWCTGSIYEALQPGELVELQEGIFRLNDDLDPVEA